MTTLFNIEQYQNPSQRDWDGANYDPAWDKPADVIPKLVEDSDQKAPSVVEVSDCEEQRVSDTPPCNGEQKVNQQETVNPKLVLSEANVFNDRWNPAHFGEVPRKVDANGNLTIFWDETIESSQALNRLVHTAIHQQTDSLREALQACKTDWESILRSTITVPQFPTEEASVC
ncbi:MAG: hypothetical protein ACFCUV_01400, partial [Rivularia sp. (in: cyanobacteria)]